MVGLQIALECSWPAGKTSLMIKELGLGAR